MSSKIMKSIGTFAVGALFTFSFLFVLAGSLSDSGPAEPEDCAPHVEKLREKNPWISDRKFSRRLLSALSSYPKQSGLVKEISGMGMDVAMIYQEVPELQMFYAGVQPVGTYCQFLFVRWGTWATITDEDPKHGGTPSYAVFQIHGNLVRDTNARFALEKYFDEALVPEWAEETKAVFGK